MSANVSLAPSFIELHDANGDVFYVFVNHVASVHAARDRPDGILSVICMASECELEAREAPPNVVNALIDASMG